MIQNRSGESIAGRTVNGKSPMVDVEANINDEKKFDNYAGRGKSCAHADYNMNGNKPEGRVLVLYTGGTIGMVRNEHGALIPMPHVFVKNLRKYPHMHDREYAEKRFGAMGPLVLPMTATDERRIVYSVLEYTPLCDSSDMSVDDWIRIANDIRDSYEHFNGFVILHGTDTLSYTASALSFMLEALGKIVILTGSQVPIFDARSDGLDNFLTSLIIAGNYSIPEVCVFFGNHLMRGNRTSKTSTNSFEAFQSPNFPPLAKAGIKIEVDYRQIFHPSTIEKFHVHSSLNRNVGLLRLFPGITAALVKASLQPPIEGVVLQSYGAGNMPSNREDIIEELRAATKRGVIIVNITQCSNGSVCNLYRPGKMLEGAGVILGFDMTPEAALTKLSYVLSKSEWCPNTKRRMMKTNLRGELTSDQQSTMKDWDLETLARCLKISSSEEINQLESILFPAMLSAAVVKGNMNNLETLKKYGADISQVNADGRTALHVACCEGDVNIVRRLLKMGANVHIQDRFNHTPLIDAIENDRHEIIKLLMQCGAHLHEDAVLIGGKMGSAAMIGNKNRLQSYHLANADLSQGDLCGRTPLHYAAMCNRVDCVRLLLNFGVDKDCVDMIGHTPLNLAKNANAAESAALLSP